MAFTWNLETFLQRIIDLNPNDLLRAVLRDPAFAEMVLDLNRIDQLFKEGVDSNNRKLFSFTPQQPYAPFTIERKIERNLPHDHVTLFHTGEFYASFRLIIFEQAFEITANPIKDDSNLFDDFGIDILGLNDRSKELLVSRLITAINPILVNFILNEGIV